MTTELNNLRYTTTFNHSTRTYDTQSIDKYQSRSIICYVRKDLVSGDIYIIDGQTSTTEHLRYKNNSGIGDTLRPYLAYGDGYIVAAKDSVLINNIYHEVLTMQPTQYSNYSTFRSVEGLGSLTSPFGLSIISSYYHVGNVSKLICFKNQYGYLHTNDLPEINCQDTNINAYLPPNTAMTTDVLIYPQPATTFVNIQLPEVVDYAKLLLYNTTGNVIYSETIQNKDYIRLNAPATSALYYYLITDNIAGKVWRGKLLFE